MMDDELDSIIDILNKNTDKPPLYQSKPADSNKITQAIAKTIDQEEEKSTKSIVTQHSKQKSAIKEHELKISTENEKEQEVENLLK